jgi:NAD(P)-dependent dehydrogenase (short-subunit alcohol dehydrogenase family)
MGKLDGKVAVITAATSGMALASAKLFVQEGAYVFITGRRKDKLDEAVKAIGRNVTGVQGDASNLDDLDRLYDTVKKTKGKIDVLFASAGMGELVKLEDVTPEHFDKTFDLNVRGTLFTVQKALPLFNDGGSIFMNGSIASIKGFPAFGVYSASKAAVRSFARTWLLELKERKIRVNVLSPGTIDTPILDPLGPDAKEFFKSQIPRGEIGRPEEIASVALFLASSDSSFVNGVELFVDGGVYDEAPFVFVSAVGRRFGNSDSQLRVGGQQFGFCVCGNDHPRYFGDGRNYIRRNCIQLFRGTQNNGLCCARA